MYKMFDLLIVCGRYPLLGSVLSKYSSINKGSVELNYIGGTVKLVLLASMQVARLPKLSF